MCAYSILPPEPSVTYETKLSSLTALLILLPMLPLAPRYPGLDPRVEQLARRLTAVEKGDLSLVATGLNRAFNAFPGSVMAEPDAEPFLRTLMAIPAVDLRDAALRSYARMLDEPTFSQLLPERRDTPPEVLLAHPNVLRQLMAASMLVSAEDPLRRDLERGIYLLNQPDELKAVLVGLLTRIWQQLSGWWHTALPALEQSCTEIRRHFGAGSPEEVFRQVTGREFRRYLKTDPDTIRRIEFLPNPCLGPYVAILAEEEEGLVQVAYGVGVQPPQAEQSADAPSAVWPGGLLPVLTALADEARLQILAMVREKGKACAQDFMQGLNLSQPATSRHMRLLEVTHLVQVERIEGVKWYRIDTEHVQQLTQALALFLTGNEGRE